MVSSRCERRAKFRQAGTMLTSRSYGLCIAVRRCLVGRRGSASTHGLRGQACLRALRPSPEQGEAPSSTRYRESVQSPRDALKACGRAACDSLFSISTCEAPLR